MTQPSSTEKLLELIRNKEAQAPEKQAKVGKPPLTARVLPRRGLARMGIEIGSGWARLALLRFDGDLPEVLAHREVELEGESGLKLDPLRAPIREMTRGSRRVHAWVVSHFAELEMRTVQVPDLPRKQVPGAVKWHARRDGLQIDEGQFDFVDRGVFKSSEGIKRGALAWNLPRHHVADLRQQLSRNAGIRIEGITLHPFCLENLASIGMLATPGQCLVHLFLGEQSSRIEILSQQHLMLTRTVKTGISGVLESLQESGGNLASITSMHQLNTLLLGSGPKLTPRDQEELITRMQPVLERIYSQVDRTIRYYSITLGGRDVEAMYLSGTAVQSSVVEQWFRARSPLPCHLLGDAVWDGIDGKDMPAPAAERDRYLAAIGAGASSPGKTPNLMTPLKTREEQRSVALVNKVVVTAAALLAILMLTGAWWVHYLADAEQVHLKHLLERVESYQPRLDVPFLEEQLAKARDVESRAIQLGQRYESLALLHELTSLVPPGIRLHQTRLELGGPPQEETGDQAPSGKIRVEGVVLGEEAELNSVLASYLLALESSPVLAGPAVQENSMQTYPGEGRVLVFSLTAEVQ